MTQKVLTWSDSQLNNGLYNFHIAWYVPCLFFVLYVRIHFRCERCDICVMIYNYMLRMALLDREFAGGFIMFL